MIIVKITGGIGNQLFQYSFGRFLSIDNNTDLKFDVQTNYDYKNFTKRKLGLNHFNINLNLATKKEVDKFKYFNNKYLAKLERKVIQKLPFLNSKYIVQDLSGKGKHISEYRDNCYYDGYWQSEKYFEPVKDIIRKDLILRLQLSKSDSDLYHDILDSESVSIHIRRGDYFKVKTNTKKFSVCSLDYYQEGIEFFKSKINNPKFFIFADEIDWAKEKMRDDNLRFVETNNDLPEIDLFLMSKCKNNIIANSSFSWWGAWLNSNPDKKVIAPKNWFKGAINAIADDIVPLEWIRI